MMGEERESYIEIYYITLVDKIYYLKKKLKG